jgi:hypothetical protein
MIENSSNIPLLSSNNIAQDSNALVLQGSQGIRDPQFFTDQAGLMVGASNIQNVFGTYVPDIGLSNNNFISNYNLTEYNGALYGSG